jgi:threonine dehydrogenase-like Zn-dependent dehydrogenase
MKAGDILGHEFMGEVVETGSGSTLQKGQRVVVPFTIACGSCFHCGKQQYSACDNGNPADNQDIAEKLYGQPMSGLFGYSHMTGGYAGGQAEYVRVPYSDVGPIVIPDGIEDDKVLFLSDILPTGWQAAENADIEPGDTVAVWGCGPVGLFAVQSAFLMGAARVIAIDHFPKRLELARRFGAETINFEETATYDALMQMTGGIGPDASTAWGWKRTGCSSTTSSIRSRNRRSSAPTVFIPSARRSWRAARAGACRCRPSMAALSTNSPLVRSWRRG